MQSTYPGAVKIQSYRLRDCSLKKSTPGQSPILELQLSFVFTFQDYSIGSFFNSTYTNSVVTDGIILSYIYLF